MQIYDIDHDGLNEVICVMEDTLLILEGKTGNVERMAVLPDTNAHDAIAIANLTGDGSPSELLLKDRYKNVYALDSDLKELWGFNGNIGHYVRPFDFDGDGKDEIIAGHHFLDHEGNELWTVDERGHMDAIWVGDMDNTPENGCEIAFAAETNRPIVYNKEGRVVWSFDGGDNVKHMQHVVMGDFRPELEGLEVAFYARDSHRLVLFSVTGDSLAEKNGYGRIAVIDMVENYAGDNRDYILLYRGSSKHPAVLDGNLNVVVEFPTPAPNKTKPQGELFAVHADLCGDIAEEVITYDKHNLFIYSSTENDLQSHLTNEPAAQQPHQINWTHYSGGVSYVLKAGQTAENNFSVFHSASYGHLQGTHSFFLINGRSRPLYQSTPKANADWNVLVGKK